MTPADKLAAAEARRRFAAEVSKRDEEIDLGRAALLVGAEEEPARCDVERCVESLERMGREARERVREAGAGSAVAALNSYLFEEQGFAGNRDDYYDPRNSMLHRVLERRTGIPITLSVVYMEVGRRAGVFVEGVGMPGHFIVRAGGLLVDPFEGSTVDFEDCQERLDAVYGGQVALSEDHLRPVNGRAIITRILGNLKAVYAQAGLHRRALAAVERILLAAPHLGEERRDRAALLTQLDRLPEALAETRRYLKQMPPPRDAESVREQLKKIQARLAALN
jgi:regulator of sirC expression with transglutaminase-like and TPR domain